MPFGERPLRRWKQTLAENDEAPNHFSGPQLFFLGYFYTPRNSRGFFLLGFEIKPRWRRLISGGRMSRRGASSSTA